MTQSVRPQAAATVRVFTQRFGSTPLGARLARHLALHRPPFRWEVLDREPVGKTVHAELDLPR